MRGGFVYMRTTQGPQRVDVIYRRIDDDFLDPLVFRSDSALGVPGLMVGLSRRARDHCQRHRYRHRRRQVDLPLRAGHGAVLPSARSPAARTCRRALRKPDDLAYTLAHLDELVVKEVHGAGGYGMLIGPTASLAEREDFRLRILAAPEKYIAQPTLALSTCPTFVEQGVAPRHIDLRPFVLSGKEITIVPGGLTRVALRAGSLVVNSSQGGGTKDTWVLED